MSELPPIENRRNWKGIVVNYQDVIAEPVDTSECRYCLTAPQVQVLMMYADTLRWRTRWINWDGEQQPLTDFADDLIRRLNMDCCGGNPVFPEMQRLAPDGSYDLQVSTDGGATWQTDNTDPRLTYPVQPPLPGSTPDLKCQAAWNIRKGFEDVVAALAAALDATLTLFAIAVAIAGVLIAFLLSPLQPLKLIPVVISLVQFLLGVSESTFTAAFSDDDYDKLQCAAFCTMDDNGQITDLGAFVDKMCSLVGCSDIPGNTFKLIAYGCGLLFINSMAGTPRGTIGYDCDACDCANCPNKDLYAIFVNAGTPWGTEVDSDLNSITVQADFITAQGEYLAAVLSSDYTQGCTVDGELVSGAIDGTTCWIDTGNNPAVVSPTCSIYGAHGVIYLQFQSTTAFTVKFTFA